SFFFSSRRRHTRCLSDWSSDVCSSDLVKEDLETKFKNSDDPLRIVFVCAMWITGFDVPSCSTIYLDKPMKNHTLMQTIARANREIGRASCRERVEKEVGEAAVR